MSGCVLAIDQGTTSTRAMVFDRDLAVLATARREITQHFPRPAWVEHDPEEIWRSVLETCGEAMDMASIAAADLAAVGIANQRETTVVWERASGWPVHNAIVWQDRRTEPECAARRAAGEEPALTAKTGLVCDPYFPATKIAWILDSAEGLRTRAERGELAFGTIDSFLLWRLTDGAVHATDATNAARTLLFDIHRGRWEPELLDRFAVPAAMLPEVRDCAGQFGETAPGILGGAVAIRGLAGDQHAALIGQACFAPGSRKATFGTGAFVLCNTGGQAVASEHRMLTTLAYQLDGRPTYALEGAIFAAGAAVQWLRDGLGIIDAAARAGELAAAVAPDHGVTLVPAFTGLGAPHWDAEARGAMFGLTRATGPGEIARAALEALAYQTRDVLEAMTADRRHAAAAPKPLRVDGGMAASDWTMQFLADILDAPVERPAVVETTALGAAYLAGFAAGLYPEPETFAAGWRPERRFTPRMDEAIRERNYARWRDAVRRTLSSPARD